MTQSNTVQDIADALQGASSLLLVSHTSPDSDAYGAMCGLAQALQKLGKKVLCANESGASEQFLYIPGVSDVISELPSIKDFDLVVVLDCGDLKRVGDSFLAELQNSTDEMVNIDHHISNDFFGKLNLVLPEHSSTAEVVFEVLQTMSVDLNQEIASCLFAGIMGDTGSFRYSSTSARTLEVAAALVRAGASPERIAQELYGRVSLAGVQLQAQALLDLKMHASGKVAEVVVSKEMFDKFGAQPDDVDMLVERARDISGVVVSAFLRELDDHWKISLRSTEAQYDVSQVAQAFGGGGHRSAAAFRWRQGPFEKLEEALINRLVKVVSP